MYSWGKYTVVVLLCACLSLLHGADARAQQIEHRLQFEEYTGSDAAILSIDEICCGTGERDWVPTREASTSFLRPVIWIRLPPLPSGEVIELPQMIDRVQLYEREVGAVRWTVQTTGDTIPVSRRPMQVAEMAIRLDPQLHGDVERYMRFQQPSSVAFSIDVWTIDRFGESADRRFLVQLLLFGFCGAMIVFNFVVAFVTREKIFAFNAATISCTMIIAIYLTGQAGYYIWPESPQWSYITLVLAMGGLSLFATQFISTYLESGPANPKLLRFNRWFGAAQFATSVVIVFTWSEWLYALLLVVGLFSMAYQLFLVFRSIFKGDRQAIPLLIPLSILIAGILIRWARTALSLDLGWANYHIMEIALALEAITFSLVLAGRIRFFARKASDAEREVDRIRLEAAERFSSLQDHERSRIASDLHDSISHSLAIAVGQLEQVGRGDPISPEASQRLDHVRANVKEAISETRRISHALHPARLDHLGMAKGLQSMFDDLARSRNIRCCVTIECHEDLLDKDEKTQVTRIVQEAVSNIVKHSRATECRFAIQRIDDTVAVSIEDNGVGETPQDDDAEGHLGLISIEQRVFHLGGTLDIEADERGFRIAFSFVPRAWNNR